MRVRGWRPKNIFFLGKINDAVVESDLPYTTVGTLRVNISIRVTIKSSKDLNMESKKGSFRVNIKEAITDLVSSGPITIFGPGQKRASKRRREG